MMLSSHAYVNLARQRQHFEPALIVLSFSKQQNIRTLTYTEGSDCVRQGGKRLFRLAAIQTSVSLQTVMITGMNWHRRKGPTTPKDEIRRRL